MDALEALPDEALARRARRGSRAAAALLFRRHLNGVWRCAYLVTGSRGLADEVAQEAFLRAFARLDRYDAARPFRPWLHRIATNLALNALRRERRGVSLEQAGEPAAPDFTSQVETADGLWAALAALTPERRAVVALRYWLGYRPEEIADLLDLPVGTVGSRLSRALADLRQQLEVLDGC